jgi:hypothetical protein
VKIRFINIYGVNLQKIKKGVSNCTEALIAVKPITARGANRPYYKYNTLKEQIKTGEIERYTKKEQIVIKKTVEKMDRYLVEFRSIKGN